MCSTASACHALALQVEATGTSSPACGAIPGVVDNAAPPAVRCLMHALAADPTHLESHLMLGSKLLEFQGQASNALKTYQMALELAPRPCGSPCRAAHLGIATALKAERRYEEALTSYEAFGGLAGTSDWELRVSHNERAECLQRLGRQTEASTLLKEAVRPSYTLTLPYTLTSRRR